jgi:AraC-like DNA-binding protein
MMKKDVNIWENVSVDLWRYTEGRLHSSPGRYDSKILTFTRIISGDILFRAENQEANASSGDWVIIRPGWREQYFNPELQVISVHLSLESLFPGAEWRGVPLVHLSERTKLDHCLNQLRATTLITRLLENGGVSPTEVAVSLADYMDYQEKVCALLRDLMSEIEPHGLRYDVPQIGDERVRQSFQRVSTLALNTPFSRRNIAEACGLSPSQLDRLWRDEVGVTAHSYWQKRKMKLACRMLLQENTLVKEVAYATGFQQVTHFSQWFQSQCKEPPTSYRRRHLNA